jgi:tetratricopeptide (TPR) repeat protein
VRIVKTLLVTSLCVAVCVLCTSCADPFKGKPPYWYNGYVYGTRAAAFFSEGRLASALSFYQKALGEAQRHDIPEQAALYAFNIGRCHFELDAYDSACRYFADAHRTFSMAGKAAQARQAAGFAALSWAALRPKADSAFSWYRLGAPASPAGEEKTFWLMVHGRLVWGRDHSKEALAYLDAAYDMYKKAKAWHGACQACYFRSRVYAYFGEYDEAARLIEEALAFGDKTDLRFDRWSVLLTAAAIYSCAKDETKSSWLYERACKCMPEGKAVPPKSEVVSCSKDLFN